MIGKRGRLHHDEGGAVLLLFGLAVGVLIIAVGVAVDVARLYSARGKMQYALDAANLAAGSTAGNAALLQVRLNAYYNANYPSTSLATPISASVTQSGTVLTATASASMNTTFMQVAGIKTMSLNVTSQVTRGISALELALVLDNTGSMFYNPGGTNNITALKNDAAQIVNTIYANSLDASKVKIAVVPYVTTVNPGLSSLVSFPLKDASGTALKDPLGAALKADFTSGANTPYWKGCVVEPSVSTNQDVTEPSGGWSGPWKPFYWPTTYSKSSPEAWDNPYFWKSSSSHNFNYPANAVSDAACLYDNGSNYTGGPETIGPNMSCPTQMTRLTNSQSTVLSAISAMQAWCRSGTMIHVGLVWGWRALSPNPPFADGAAYNTPGLVKAVVIETDGQNNWNNLSSFGSPYNSDLSGFGRVTDGLLGISSTSSAPATLDNRLATLCTNMKAAGIIIYAVAFSGSGASVSSALQGCATDSSKYFQASDQDALQSAFEDIATSLNNLRVSK